MKALVKKSHVHSERLCAFFVVFANGKFYLFSYEDNNRGSIFKRNFGLVKIELPDPLRSVWKITTFRKLVKVSLVDATTWYVLNF